MSEPTLLESFINMRKQYEDVYNRAWKWMREHPEKQETEEYRLIQAVIRFADEGIGRCNIKIRLLGGEA